MSYNQKFRLLSLVKILNMQQENAFQSIRPYTNDEIKDVLNQLLEEPDFQKVLSIVYPKQKLSDVIDNLRKISTIKEFQREVVYYYLRIIIDKTINKLSFSGLDNLEPGKKIPFYVKSSGYYP
jgi:hypothetical protein